MAQSKHKSQSVKRRDLIRMMKFNMKKKEEELTWEINVFNDKIEDMKQELARKSKKIFQLELEVSKLKFSAYKSKSKLGKFTIKSKPLRYFFLRFKSYYFGYYGPDGKFQNHTFSCPGLFFVKSEIHPQV